MKRIAVFVLGLLALVACSEKEASELQSLTLTAIQPGADTKTSRNDAGNVFWYPGDRIGLIVGSSNVIPLTSYISQPAAAADFTGSVPDLQQLGEYFAIYPYSRYGISGQYDYQTNCLSISTSLPSVQKAVEGTFDTNLFISVARSTSKELTFRHVTGGVRFSIGTSGVKKVVLRTETTNLTGYATIKLLESGVEATPLFNTINQIVNNEVVLAAPEGESLQPGSSYYFVTLPANMEQGFTLTFYTDDKYAVRTVSKPVEIQSGRFAYLPDADQGVEWKPLSADLEDTTDTPIEQNMVFHAGFGPTTRTARQADGKVFWSPNETIAVCRTWSSAGSDVEADKASLFVSTNTVPAASADFVGTMPADFGGDESYKKYNANATRYWAVYPYCAESFFRYDLATHQLPGVQTAVPDTFPDNLYIAAACSNDNNLHFQHPLGGIKFSLVNEGAVKATLSTNNFEGLWGFVSLEYYEGVITASESYFGESNEYTSIVLTPADGGTFIPGKAYYFVTLPAHMQNGFTLTFEDAQGRTISRVINSEVVISRADFRTLMEADKGMSWDVSSVELDSDGTGISEFASTFTVLAKCQSDYEVSFDCDWLKEIEIYGVTGGDPRVAGCTHAFLAKANRGQARTGHVLFKAGSETTSFEVTQAAGNYLPVIPRHHLGFIFRSIDNKLYDFWKHDMFNEIHQSCSEGYFDFAEGFYGQNGSSTFLAGQPLANQYKSWGAIDGRARVQGWSDQITADDVKALMQETDDYYIPLTSIGVRSSSVDEGSRMINAEVEVYASKAGSYKLTGLLLEDSISYIPGGEMFSMNGIHSIVGFLTDAGGDTVVIDSDGGSKLVNLSVQAPAEYHGEAGNWGDLGEMYLMLYVQAPFGDQAKVNAGAPLNGSKYYIDNSRRATVGTVYAIEK